MRECTPGFDRIISVRRRMLRCDMVLSPNTAAHEPIGLVFRPDRMTANTCSGAVLCVEGISLPHRQLH
jgi:hypothetical protein